MWKLGHACSQDNKGAARAGGIVSGLDRQVQGVTRRIIRNVIQV